ncbi:MAG: ABC transporter permease [Micrococcaceae bacterium]
MSTLAVEDKASDVVKAPVSYKAPIMYAVFALVAAILFIFNGARGHHATFDISDSSDKIKISPIVMPAMPVGIITTLICIAVIAASYYYAQRSEKQPWWLPAIFGTSFMVGFLTWVVSKANTNEISLANLIAGAVTLSIPLVFGSLSGVLCERVGVVNIAIEGQLLGGAFTAAMVGTMTGSPYIGMIAAAIAGVLVASLLAVFCIKYFVDQIIVGVVLNVLISGLTGFFYSTMMTANQSKFNTPNHLPNISIPFLNQIPIIGPILFRQSIIGYFMYAAVILVYIGLFHTKWGLRVRAVGEHPEAADTVGINVNKTRFQNVLLGGAIAGLGGAFFTLVSVDSFTKDMTAGKGFIALAALIFGRWNPIGAFFAALLFGFADNLQSIMTIIGTPVPSSFMAMLPYAATIFAVAGLVGHSRGPAAAGVPYKKG